MMKMDCQRKSGQPWMHLIMEAEVLVELRGWRYCVFFFWYSPLQMISTIYFKNVFVQTNKKIPLILLEYRPGFN